MLPATRARWPKEPSRFVARSSESCANTFSLGMRQRLGIAAALLGDPEVIVMDEPGNGLDAEGVRWVRGLLRGLAAEGRTVFVSSHLMSEMQQTTDHLLVIGRGRLVILSVTGEYSNGAIRSTLQWVPRRGLLFVARSLVVLTVTTAGAMFFSAATNLVSGVLMGDSAIVDISDIAASIGRIGLYVSSASVLSIGLAWAVRNTAAALTAVFLLQLVLPVMLPSFGVDLLATIGENLPGYANAGFLEAMQLEVATTAIVSVLSVWLVSSVDAGAWSLLTRDAA